MTREKYIRLFLSEPALQRRLGLLLLLFIAAFLEMKCVQGQAKELKRVQAERALVARIPEFEKTIQDDIFKRAIAAQEAQDQPAGTPKRESSLKGMMIKDGIPYALIDEVMYKVGDSLGEYTITNITKKEITLESRETREVKILQFPPD